MTVTVKYTFRSILCLRVYDRTLLTPWPSKSATCLLHKCMIILYKLIFSVINLTFVKQVC
jgi:hypothetical protein